MRPPIRKILMLRRHIEPLIDSGLLDAATPGNVATCPLELFDQSVDMMKRFMQLRAENPDEVYGLVHSDGSVLRSDDDNNSSPELNSDVSSTEARALHRVVRAIHDGNCPKCGYLGSSDSFFTPGWNSRGVGHGYHKCPKCSFRITEEEAAAAMEQFRPYMQANVEVFERWRSARAEAGAGPVVPQCLGPSAYEPTVKHVRTSR